MRAYLDQNGVSHLTTPPHTPGHNGLSERKHRHVVEMRLTLLSKEKIPKTYWPYAFATTVYLINRLPTPVLKLESPFEKLFGLAPNYEKLCIFGCLCFPWLMPYNKHKLEDRSTKCVFLGYSITQSAYMCLQVATCRLYVSRHVQFHEESFPFQTLSSHELSDQSSQNTPQTQQYNPVTIVPVHSTQSPPVSSARVRSFTNHHNRQRHLSCRLRQTLRYVLKTLLLRMFRTPLSSLLKILGQEPWPTILPNPLLHKIPKHKTHK